MLAKVSMFRLEAKKRGKERIMVHLRRLPIAQLSLMILQQLDIFVIGPMLCFGFFDMLINVFETEVEIGRVEIS